MSVTKSIFGGSVVRQGTAHATLPLVFSDAASIPALLALLDGGGSGPVSTFANLPPAVDNVGKIYRVSDVGPVGVGSLWKSRGTRWGTLTGREEHCSASGTLASPLATVTSASTKFVLPAGDRVSSGSILLPVGLPQVGQGIAVSAKFRHKGTGGAWTTHIRTGNLDSISDSSFANYTGTAVNNQDLVLEQTLEVVSSTSFITPQFLFNGAYDSALALRATNFNNAQQIYIGFYSGGMTAPDTIDLISYRIFILG